MTAWLVRIQSEEPTSLRSPDVAFHRQLIVLATPAYMDKIADRTQLYAYCATSGMVYTERLAI